MAKKVARKGKKKLSKKYASFSGRMVMIGFGSIGQGVLPLIFRHIDIKPEQITVISAEDRGGLKELKRFGVTFIRKRLTRENFRQTLDKRVGKGDFLVNLSVEVASTALVELCQEKGALLHRHLHRAVAGRLHRPQPVGVAALQLCAAREHAEAGAEVPRRADGGDRPRRQPRPGLALRQEGAGQPRQGHRPGRREARPPARAGASWRATSASR